MRLRSRNPHAPAKRVPDLPETVTVRPVRAAFGPRVSIVSVDNQGHLWIRFSTAVIALVAGLLLVLIPVLALLWVSNGLIDSGQVNFKPGTTQTDKNPGPSITTDLPLADTSKKERRNH
jgi:hypothetical protein